MDTEQEQELTEEELGHEEFKARYKRGEYAVQFAAAYIKQMLPLYTVVVPEQTLAERYQDRYQHSDGGDLIVNDRIWEVKWLTVPFTDKKWTYGNWWIVDSVYSYHNHDKDNMPELYMTFSKDLRWYGVVHCHTYDDWWITEKYNKNTKRKENFYFIQLDQVSRQPTHYTGKVPTRFPAKLEWLYD